MFRLIFSFIVLFSILDQLFGQEATKSSVCKLSTKNSEIEIARILEKSKAEIDFCKKNVGRAFNEIDISKMGSTEAYEMGVDVITEGLIASKYERYGDFSKAADYYYYDYLVQIGKRPWKSEHSWSSPGDSTPFPTFMHVLKRNQDYQRMLKVYPEYFNYYFHRFKGTLKEKTNLIEEQMRHDPELKETYETFMQEWREVKRLSKTASPKLLDPTVQRHEWFYSDKPEEVLKALSYYHECKVDFMLEKALAHKDPVVVAKAKEYLEDLKKGEKNETGAKPEK